MKNRIAATAAAAALALGGLAYATSPATAAADTIERSSRGCVTEPEYRRVKRGMTQTKVHRVFGTKGRVTTQGYGMKFRQYKVCNDRFGFVTVDYTKRGGKFKVTGKFAYWASEHSRSTG
ncbi:hypothetical protein MF406_18025 (plasmid) [Georgenia sp. TF02-10]|uniref:hypothetical protein n=1 Tax=Georgenia sp. TF02-10 TaxID=2917725 RepID=UPI001FA7A85D|nr:hypothetical protein [Georgenia sp. TF02-10]UNX56551.1 hypothetical protein MF406_18025 [Georgenia sp. TF02-10]